MNHCLQKIFVKACVFDPSYHILMVDYATFTSDTSDSITGSKKNSKVIFGGVLPISKLPVMWLLQIIHRETGLCIQHNQLVPYQFSVANHDDGREYDLHLYYLVFLARRDGLDKVSVTTDETSYRSARRHWIPLPKLWNHVCMELQSLCLSDQEFLTYLTLTHKILQK